MNVNESEIQSTSPKPEVRKIKLINNLHFFLVCSWS
jgi:hypothetical protein